MFFVSQQVCGSALGRASESPGQSVLLLSAFQEEERMLYSGVTRPQGHVAHVPQVALLCGLASCPVPG